MTVPNTAYSALTLRLAQVKNAPYQDRLQTFKDK